MNTISLVDDDRLVLQFCRCGLKRRENLVLLESSNAREALECAGGHRGALLAMVELSIGR